jgi:hypothetical protein
MPAVIRSAGAPRPVRPAARRRSARTRTSTRTRRRGNPRSSAGRGRPVAGPAAGGCPPLADVQVVDHQGGWFRCGCRPARRQGARRPTQQVEDAGDLPVTCLAGPQAPNHESVGIATSLRRSTKRRSVWPFRSSLRWRRNLVRPGRRLFLVAGQSPQPAQPDEHLPIPWSLGWAPRHGKSRRKASAGQGWHSGDPPPSGRLIDRQRDLSASHIRSARLCRRV